MAAYSYGAEKSRRGDSARRGMAFGRPSASLGDTVNAEPNNRADLEHSVGRSAPAAADDAAAAALARRVRKHPVSQTILKRNCALR